MQHPIASEPIRRFRRVARHSARRGATLVLLAVTMVAMLGFMALAVDLAMLQTARAEAQRAADAIALAGASAYLSDPTNPVPVAKDKAKQFAAQNFIRGVVIDTMDVTGGGLICEGSELKVEVMPASYKVRVWTHRGGLSLWFANVLGREFGAVSAYAAAEAAEAGAIECIKPWAIPDQNYSSSDLGKLDTLKIPSDEPVEVEDSWFYAIRLPPHEPEQMEKTSCTKPRGENPSQGTEQDWGNCPEEPGTGSCWYRSYICNDNCQPVNLGMEYTVEKGNMIGPTAQGVNALLLEDPDIRFDESTRKLVRDGLEVDPKDSPRAIKVGLYNPQTYTHPDQYTINLTGFAYFFLENGPHTYKGRTGLYDPDQAEAIVGRFLYYAEGSEGGPSTTPFARLLRLVE